MGKGYNNYMCKKPFHPGSKANIKRTWMAEQRTVNEKQKQDELRVQYEKEQELYNNKALLSKESKDKLALNFMYEAPPGAKKERQKEDDEPEYKFEWQRKYNAPREDFAKNNKEIRDQPFGIPVRNVRCIKCHQWGHVNTDRECPLYHQASSSSLPSTSMDPLELMRQMRDEGLALKQSILGHHLDSTQNNQHFVASEEEEDPEMAFLKALSTKQKKKLLRKLNKLADNQKRGSKKEKKRKKSKKSRKKNHSSDSDSSTDTTSTDDESKAARYSHESKEPRRLKSRSSGDKQNQHSSSSHAKDNVSPSRDRPRSEHKKRLKRHRSKSPESKRCKRSTD